VKIYFRKLAVETKAAFDVNAANYLADDIHRGEDLTEIGLCLAQASARLGRQVDVLYAGVGPGHLAARLVASSADIRAFYGLDYSSRMLALARESLGDCGTARLVRQDLLDPDLRRRRRQSFDVCLLLNNTLGNMVAAEGPVEARVRCLEVLHEVLRPGGSCVLTVYDFQKLEGLNGSYTPKLKILEKTGDGDFILKLAANGHSHLFYSHWFTERELHDLVQSAGFRICAEARRGQRLIVVCERT
jgi:SAM-dependent methyltransferase